MYSISGYGKMIADVTRMNAYVEAMRQVIRPNSVVLDLGTGPGLFALIACQLGARLVYAVEPENIIQLTRDAAVANGFVDRIVCLQSQSTSVTLPEYADVIVSDLRGVLPWFQKHLPAILDARKRLLGPGGKLIPARDTLWAAIVAVPECYSKLIAPWETNRFNLNLDSARRVVTNTWVKARIKPEQLLTEPTLWHILDYSQVAISDIAAQICLSITCSGTAHGLAVWFDTELLEGVGFSNHPREPELIYGQGFFPFPQPVEIAAGDSVSIELRADLVLDDYIWSWRTVVCGHGETESVKAEFKQSTFLGALLSAAQLRKQAASFVPELNEEGKRHALALSLMKGKISLQKIAEQLWERFPQTYADLKDALSDVSELSRKYSQ